MEQALQAHEKIETHGPAVTNFAVGFVMLLPVLGFIVCRLGAWLMS